MYVTNTKGKNNDDLNEDMHLEGNITEDKDITKTKEDGHLEVIMVKDKDKRALSEDVLNIEADNANKEREATTTGTTSPGLQ